MFGKGAVAPLPSNGVWGLVPSGSRAEPWPFSRRLLLLGAAAALIPKPDWLDTLAARVAAIGGLGLLRSYDVAGSGAFDRAHENCAYVYDNAVVGMALLAGGRVAPARRLGDALVAAQGRDRFWKDGRLRNAYAAGIVAAAGDYPLPGWWDAGQGKWVEDAYQVSTATGVVAWAMLFWMALFRATGDARYQDAAGRAGDWVERVVRVSAGYGGGFLGWEPSPVRLGWVSTEHNLDLAVAFAAMGRTEAASHAAGFVARMWQAGEARFASGLTPAGAVNPHSAADANIWPLLAPGARPAWRGALDWVLARQGVPAAAPEGVDFDTDRDGIWLEGTAYVALAARRAGAAYAPVRARMMATLRAQTAGSGLVWACSVPALTTGLSTGLVEADGRPAPFLYFRRPHIAATGWAALAALDASPFAL